MYNVYIYIYISYNTDGQGALQAGSMQIIDSWVERRSDYIYIYIHITYN